MYTFNPVAEEFGNQPIVRFVAGMKVFYDGGMTEIRTGLWWCVKG